MIIYTGTVITISCVVFQDSNNWFIMVHVRKRERLLTPCANDIELVFSKSLRTDYPDVSRTDITVAEEGIPEAINYTEFREPLLENNYS